MTPTPQPKVVPAKAGIGLRSLHYQEIVKTKPNIAWLEGHTENFFAPGGIVPYITEQIAQHYPLSLHGVGLSLGSSTLPDKTHLEKVKNTINRYNPALVSEHVSWSNTSNMVLNDLLPLPYTNETVEIVSRNIDHVQNVLGRQILIENPSTYLEFNYCQMSEYEFMARLVDNTNCGILLDVNNIYVGHINHGINIEDYLANIPKAAVQEIHLAGHATREVEGQTVLIDHHGDFVCDEVWQIFETAINLIGNVPTLIEWDTDIPDLSTLLAEAKKAQYYLDKNEKHAIA